MIINSFYFFLGIFPSLLCGLSCASRPFQGRCNYVITWRNDGGACVENNRSGMSLLFFILNEVVQQVVSSCLIVMTLLVFPLSSKQIEVYFKPLSLFGLYNKSKKFD